MEKFSHVCFLIICCLFLTTGFGQTPTPPKPQQTPPETSKDDGEVVKITTNLIQIDVVVTDKNGKQVTDLKPEDFEILENGKKQEITNFSYVTVSPDSIEVTSPKAKQKSDDKLTPQIPTKLKPEQVRRTVALVVDDLGLSFQSTAFVRQALKKFVDEQMQPGDLVAIIRTAGGMGALQQFTSDKRQLYAAIERVRWDPAGRGGVGAFASIESDPSQRMRDEARQAVRGGMGDGERGGQRRDASADRDENDLIPGEELDQFREDLFAVGTLGALNYVVRGMRELPGRKSVLLMSDGVKIFNRDDPSR